MLAISLMRMGAKKSPFYRIVIKEKRSKRDGKYLENVGTYNPMTNPAEVDLKHDRIQYWLSVGAQPTETVASLIKHNPEQTEEEKAAALQTRAEKKEAERLARLEAKKAEAAKREEERLAAEKAEAEKAEAEKAEAEKAEAEAAASAEAETAETSEEQPAEVTTEETATEENAEAAGE
jgi:small subunit ribosomal protein S16